MDLFVNYRFLFFSSLVVTVSRCCVCMYVCMYMRLDFDLMGCRWGGRGKVNQKRARTTFA